MTAKPFVLLSAAAAVLLAGCSSTDSGPGTPVRTGFLSKYHHMDQVDASTWRYINYDRLGSYKRFIIPPVKVLATEFEGKALTEADKQKASEFTRRTVVEALADKYPVVETSSVDVAELRIAVTGAFERGRRVGLTIEAEILDSFSTVQVAAVVKAAEGEPHLTGWWDSASARQIIKEFASRVRWVVDQGQRR